MHPGRLEGLRDVYTESLREAVQERPHDYPWHPAKSVEEVADKMIDAIKARGNLGGVTITNSLGWKKTAKKLEIKCTYKAFEEWLRC